MCLFFLVVVTIVGVIILLAVAGWKLGSSALAEAVRLVAVAAAVSW